LAAGAAWVLEGVLQAQPSPHLQSGPQPQSQGWQAQGLQGHWFGMVRFLLAGEFRTSGP